MNLVFLLILIHIVINCSLIRVDFERKFNLSQYTHGYTRVSSTMSLYIRTGIFFVFFVLFFLIALLFVEFSFYFVVCTTLDEINFICFNICFDVFCSVEYFSTNNFALAANVLLLGSFKTTFIDSTISFHFVYDHFLFLISSS